MRVVLHQILKYLSNLQSLKLHAIINLMFGHVCNKKSLAQGKKNACNPKKKKNITFKYENN